MSRRILLAVDGSTCSLHAARYLAERRGDLAFAAELDLVYVNLPVSARAASAVGREIVDGWYEKEAEKDTAAVRKLLDERGIPYRMVRKAGRAGVEICRHVERRDCDLVVMGSHGHGRLASLLMGSVTQAVLAGCDVPVLIVRAGPRRDEQNRVLVPVDGSAYTRHCIEYLLLNQDVVAPGASLTLLHVSPPPPQGPFRAASSKERAFHRAQIERALGAARRLAARGKAHFDEKQAIGDPGTEIARIAREGRYALIAMGSHGRGAAASLLLGSVAQKTIAGCTTPVLVVR